MNALTIRLWCNWCDGGRVDNPKQSYYKLLLNGYKGTKEQFPEWHAVTQSKSKLKGRDIMDVQREFNAEVDALLQKYRNNTDRCAS